MVTWRSCIASSSALCTFARARIVNERPDQIGRQKIRRELQSLEAGLDRRGHRFDGKRFGQTRHAFEQNVTVGKKAEQQAVDQIFLADNDMRNVRFAAVAARRGERRPKSGGYNFWLRGRKVKIIGRPL